MILPRRHQRCSGYAESRIKVKLPHRWGQRAETVAQTSPRFRSAWYAPSWSERRRLPANPAWLKIENLRSDGHAAA